MALDLWTPAVDESRLHPNFKTVKHVASQGCLEVIDEWASGFVDRDGKFVKEFQTTFNSSFWELYLHAAFRELGYVHCFDQPAPDFELHRSDEVIVAEAAVASNAGGYRPEWDKQGMVLPHDFNIHQAVRYTTLRLSNAIAKKSEKYLSSYKDLEHVASRPFVVCVAPFDFPFSFDWSQVALRKVLYGLDEPIVYETPNGERILIGEAQMESITKAVGVEVPMALFRDDRFAHISAVVFSSLATFSKVRALSSDPEEGSVFRAERYNAYSTAPLVTIGQKPDYRESLLDGLMLCLNPFAHCPFDITPFREAEVAVEGWDVDDDHYVAEVPHEWLIRRFVFTARTGDPKAASGLGDGKRGTYKEFDRPKWPDRELRPAKAQVGVGVNNHLAHIDDWTSVVFQDAVDGTWHAMAVNLIVHSIPEFRDANKSDEVRTVSALDDHETRDAAFTSICRAIEESKEGGS